MDIFIVLVVLGLLVWFWIDTLQARERATLTAQQTCQRMNVQFLDQTVALESIKPRRNGKGHLAWQRIYGFDFSIQGHERRHGRTFVLGHKLEQIQMDTENGTIIDPQP